VKNFAIPASVGPEVDLLESVGNAQEKCIDFRCSVESNKGIVVTINT
jgi:hypothetical protein